MHLQDIREVLAADGVDDAHLVHVVDGLVKSYRRGLEHIVALAAENERLRQQIRDLEAQQLASEGGGKKNEAQSTGS